MDGSTFDRLARAVSGASSRRRALGGLLGALGLLGARVDEAAAKNCKKITNKAKRKKCLAKAKGTTPVPPSCPEGQRLCRGVCLSVLICCDENDCAGGRTCQDGTCACPAAKPHECDGSTLCRECCVRDDCPSRLSGDGLTCVNGQCTCTIRDTHRCPSGTNWSGACGFCCGSGECSGGKECGSPPGEVPPRCLCVFGKVECNGVCVPLGCANLCNEQCPTGVEIDQPCCSGTGALVCRPEAQGSTAGTCRP